MASDKEPLRATMWRSIIVSVGIRMGRKEGLIVIIHVFVGSKPSSSISNEICGMEIV